MYHPKLPAAFPYLVASSLALSLLATSLSPVRAEAPTDIPEALPTEALPTEVTPAASEALTIADIASSSGTFNILSTALEAAELVDVLSSTGPYTVFAPTDEAFATLPPEAIEALLLPENKESLIDLLTYHVVPGAFFSTDLETGEVATVEGSAVAIETGETISVDSAQVVTADVVASNGVIHAIDRVIIPPVDLADE